MSAGKKKGGIMWTSAAFSINPEKDWEDILSEASGAPPESSLFA